MRVRSLGVGPPEDAGALEFAGREIPVKQSDSIASALLASGQRGMRRDQDGGLRGVWCGMGVCHECTVSVDSDGGSLACVTPACDGQQVAEQPVYRLVPSAAAAARQETELRCEVLVIGAGPAGLAAARDLALAGRDVLIVDERAKLGGQFYKQPSKGLPLEPERLDAQYQNGRQLIEEVRQAGVTVLSGASVWAAFESDRFLARSDTERWVIRPQRVVLATGAYERGVPIPGWTLPGVMTTGAGQSLLRSYQVAPGAQVLIAGNGPLNIQLAAELARAGVRVVGLVEAARMVSPRRVLSGVRMALNSLGLTLDGVRYLAGLMLKGVRIDMGAVVERLDGDYESGVVSATIARLDGAGRATGRRRTVEVDAVCLGYGFLPSNDIARSLGCTHRFDADRETLVTETDGTGRTSIPTVWSIGDSAGVRGAKFAQAQGSLAAAAVVADLAGEVTAEVLQDSPASRRHLRFQAGVNGLFQAPVLTDQLSEPDTVVCRCESVTHAEIVGALSEESSAPGSVKRITRAGMGKCQGRYCGPTLVALHSRQTGAELGERSGFAPQAPVKPVPIGDVAAP